MDHSLPSCCGMGSASHSTARAGGLFLCCLKQFFMEKERSKRDREESGLPQQGDKNKPQQKDPAKHNS